jgi:hypothetical protein
MSHCKNPIYIIVRVKQISLLSGRRTWSFWPLCRQHYEEFMKDPKKWGSTDKNGFKARVLEFRNQDITPKNPY